MTLVVAGDGAQALAKALCEAGRHPLGHVEFKTFPDGEEYVRILEPVKDEDVVVVQSTFPASRVMKLLLLLNAAKENGARSVRAVVPYLAYARQDRIFQPGESLSVKLIAQIIGLHASECFTVDLHKDESCQLFKIPVHNLSAEEPIAAELKRLRVDSVLAPDSGALPRVQAIARRIGVAHDHLEKTRVSSEVVQMKPKQLDVKGQRVAVVDDIISTGGTIATAVEELLKQGASSVFAVAVHGLFLGAALEKLKRAGVAEILSTDTVPSPYSRISVASVIARAMAERLTASSMR